MRASTSIWSRSMNRLFGTAPAKVTRRKARRPATLGRGFESLEDRTVLSVSFGSALSIGNDVGDSSKSFDVATDQAGNSYLTGTFSGTVDFDPEALHSGDADILTARGSNDAFVAKYAPDNSLAWVQRMGGDKTTTTVTITDFGRKIEVDGNGNVYVVGEFTGPADFGSTTLSTAGDVDGFVAKLNAGGTVQWAKSWGTTAYDNGNGIGVDSAGNVYALGSRWNDAYTILKFSPTGSTVWSKSIGAYGAFSNPDLTVDALGNVFVAGSFSGTVDFDPGPKTKYASSGASCCGVPNEAGFVLKLNKAGKFDWVSPFVGQVVGATKGYAYATSVALDSSGNVVVGGSYNNSVDFNPGSGTTMLPTIGRGFIAKLNSSGGLVWARALESNSSTFVYGLAVDTAGSIYATGSFFGTVDLNPGAGSHTRTTAGGGDIFVVQLTAAGNFGWAETFGGTGDDGGFGIAVDSTGVVHLAGYYRGTVDFDPDPLSLYNLTNPGTFSNGFRLRLRQG